MAERYLIFVLGSPPSSTNRLRARFMETWGRWCLHCSSSSAPVPLSVIGLVLLVFIANTLPPSSWSVPCPRRQIVHALTLGVASTPCSLFTILTVVSCPSSSSWGFPTPHWAPSIVVGLPSPELSSIHSRWAPFAFVVLPSSSSGFPIQALGSVHCRCAPFAVVGLCRWVVLRWSPMPRRFHHRYTQAPSPLSSSWRVDVLRRQGDRERQGLVWKGMLASLCG